MGKIIEGLWDCKYCSKKGIGGSIRECPDCGKPRDKDTKFYMPNQIKYVDEEKAKTISKEPDWLCRFCDSLNSATYDVCQYCGSARTSENLDYFENRKKTDCNEFTEVQEAKSSEDIHSEYFNFEKFDSNDNELRMIDSEYSESEEKASKTHEFDEDDLVEENSEKGDSKEDDFSDISSEETETRNSKLKSGFTAIKDKCSDFYECYLGEFIRAAIIIGLIIATVLGIVWIFTPKTQIITVYKTKYYYEIDKWLFDRTLETYGYDKSPYWEDVSNLKSDERESSRKEKYYIRGTNTKGKYKEIEMSYDEWNDVMVGDTIKVKVSIFGNGKIA